GAWGYEDFECRAYPTLYSSTQHQSVAKVLNHYGVLQNPKIVVCTVDAEHVEVARKLTQMDREVCVAMHDSFRCMGVWMLGAKLDGTAWSAKDLAVLRERAMNAEKELWGVMQGEYTLITAMEDGVEIPKELLVEPVRK
ncbi:MAG: hypothetical protein KIH89_000530, partial [Candidatus Shapirobacteria bacterium]|nr:hypothetical protein [Candidatus Shapirobacteria bacterium]